MTGDRPRVEAQSSSQAQNPASDSSSTQSVSSLVSPTPWMSCSPISMRRCRGVGAGAGQAEALSRLGAEGGGGRSVDGRLARATPARRGLQPSCWNAFSSSVVADGKKVSFASSRRRAGYHRRTGRRSTRNPFLPILPACHRCRTGGAGSALIRLVTHSRRYLRIACTRVSKEASTIKIFEV